MFERLNTPQEAFNHQLGAAVTMEQTVLEMLDKNIEEAHDERVKQLFRHHQDETRQHITNLQQVFAAFGWEVDDSPCPAIQGIDKEGKANAKKADDSIVDSIILGGAMETEHHEMAVYENLILNAQALGRQEAVRLLEQNLEQEQHTLAEVKEAARRVAAASPQPAA
jgi:ferritin-like metal-binding protein YciE